MTFYPWGTAIQDVGVTGVNAQMRRLLAHELVHSWYPEERVVRQIAEEEVVVPPA